MATILIPTPLRKFTGNNATFHTTAGNVHEAILELAKQHEPVSRHLLDDRQQIRHFLRIYVGEDDITALQQENTPLSADSVVSIVPAIAGGSR